MTQSTSTILMIRPVNFAFNEQTACTNTFQDASTRALDVHEKALREFDQLVEKLRASLVNVLVINDVPEPHTPDSIFPNNWFSTHADGRVFIYPMEAPNRRFERRPVFLNYLREHFQINDEIDLSYFEEEGIFLEGTGSMILDRANQIAYACLSPRTNIKALNHFCDLSSYRSVTFEALDSKDKAIYHTNVMMSLGETFAVVCLSAIRNSKERSQVYHTLKSSGKAIIEIDFEQVKHFAGNMLQVKSTTGNSILVLSTQAYKSLHKWQINALEQHCTFIHSQLDTIESCGGGSARCMMAEIFLDPR